MRHLIVVAASTFWAAAAAAGASAQSNGTDCSYTRTDGASPVATVYTDQGATGGMTGTAALAAGVCLNTGEGPIQGGAVEVGTGEDPAAGADDPDAIDAYAVADGDDDNIGPLDSYIGVSNYETAVKDASCNDSTSGTGSNSGGCMSYGTIGRVAVPLIVCGGGVWAGTGDDGCDLSKLTPAGSGQQANGSDCSYTTTGDPLVGVQAGRGGMTDDADFAVGVCVNAADGSGLEGGSLEAGAGNGGQGYAVFDGDNQNADPLDMYRGVSNYETGSTDANCADGPGSGSGSNSGRCFGFEGGPWVDLGFLPIPRPICGNTEGNTWTNTSRDGTTELFCELDGWSR